MRKINNKYLGDFYIEELENREERDRVKLYDSDENYLDYLPLERCDDTDPTFEEQYDGYIKMLESFETVPDLMDWLVCDCDFIGNKDQTIEYLHKELNWEKQKTAKFSSVKPQQTQLSVTKFRGLGKAIGKFSLIISRRTGTAFSTD